MDIKEVLSRLITAPKTEDGDIILDEEFSSDIIECLKEHAHEPVIKTYQSIRGINEYN